METTLTMTRKPVLGSIVNPEKALIVSERMIAANRENGKKGGRPAGLVAKSTQIALQLKEMYAKMVQEHAPSIIMAMIHKAQEGDVSAGKEVLDRVVGRSVETVNHQGEIALKLDVFR